MYNKIPIETLLRLTELPDTNQGEGVLLEHWIRLHRISEITRYTGWLRNAYLHTGTPI